MKTAKRERPGPRLRGKGKGCPAVQSSGGKEAGAQQGDEDIWS